MSMTKLALLLLLQWSAALLKAGVLENSAKFADVLSASSWCLSGTCAAAAAKAYVTITANLVSLKVGGLTETLIWTVSCTMCLFTKLMQLL